MGLDHPVCPDRDAAGNLVLLRREGTVLEGRFLPGWAAFMGMRHERGIPEASSTPRYDRTQGHAAATRLPAVPSDNLVAFFLACLLDPIRLSFGYRLDPDTGRPTHTRLTAPDGSWTEVALAADDRGVVEGGPRRVWGTWNAVTNCGASSADPIGRSSG